ncbi:MAG: caspase family protein [Armatimonadota bacterium]|nr:caspase family protein [Armatimonadota bacterium]
MRSIVPILLGVCLLLAPSFCRAEGDLYVLTVGVNAYKGTFPPLNYACADAQGLAGALQAHGKGLFSHVHTQVLLDERVSRASVEAAFNQIISQAKSRDTFVFDYAGYDGSAPRSMVKQATVGSRPSEGLFHLAGSEPGPPEASDRSGKATDSEFYLLPPSVTDKNDTAMVAAQGISATLLKTLCAKVQAQRQLIVLDTCYSENAFADFVSQLTEQQTSVQQLLKRNVTVMASEGIAYEDSNLGHGALTYSLLQGLSGKADGDFGDGLVTARELEAYLYRTTPGLTNRQQRPITYVTGSDFPLATTPNYVGAMRAGRAVEDEPEPAKVAPAAKGRNYALLFATDKYDKFDTLTNPINDAHAIAEALESDYHFDGAEVLENPTHDAIYTKLAEYAKKAYGPKDQLLLFFAGHGVYDDTFKEGYVVAQDSQPDEPGKSSLISHSYLRTMVDGIPCPHILLALDVCFGGTFDRKVALGGTRGGLYDKLPKAELISRKMKWKSRLYLTSGGKEYVPDGRPGQHSPFARQLLAALRSDGGKAGLLTFNDLLNYAQQVNPAPCAGDFGTNEPGGDFLFVTGQ